jgi:hypothetical protein
VSAVFPASFFLFMGYTEAPLLAFMVSSLFYARQGKWWLAGLLAGAAALTKQPGIFILIPLAYIFWRQYLANHHTWSRPQKMSWLWLLVCPLAAASYTLYRYLYLAAPIANVADVGGEQKLTIPGLPLIYALQVMRPDNPLLPFNILDVAFTLVMILLVAGVVLKVRSTPYTLFTLVLAIANLSDYMWTYPLRPEVNAPRRMLIIFPIFIYLALAIPDKRSFRFLLYVSFAFFLVLSGLFANWIFIS